MMQDNSQSAAGMVAYSAANPQDEIPVGPQVFPYGSPQNIESQVEPYLASGYNAGVTNEITAGGNYLVDNVQTSAMTTEYAQPEVQYQTSGLTTEYQTVNNQGTINYEYGETPVNYDVGAYQTQGYQEAAYQTINSPETQITNQYQTDVQYQPVVKTVMAPKVVTSYVASPVNDLGQTFTPPPVSTPNLEVQQPLPNPETVPLPAPIQAPFMIPKPIPLPPAELTIGNDHYVSNYPIYENDPRRRILLSQNASVLQQQVGVGVVPVSGAAVAPGLQTSVTPGLQTSVTPGLQTAVTPGLQTAVTPGLQTGLGTGVVPGLQTGLGTGVVPGLQTGLGAGVAPGLQTGLGTGVAPGLQAGVNGLNIGVNNLGTGINNLGTGLNNLTSGTGTGIANTLNNAANNTANGLSNGLNNLAGNATSTADNLRSGIDSGLSNFANKVGDVAQSAVDTTKEGLNNLGTGIKNAFN